MSQFANKNKSRQANQFNMELTVSARNKTKPALLDGDQKPFPVSLYYPEEVLEEFRNIIEDSQLSGKEFYNPFTEEVEQFPQEASAFTARHLQLLARNESVNTHGRMDCGLYGGLLTDDQIASIRCLVKQTVVVGKVRASHSGGYGSTRVAFAKPEEVIIIDQIGFQWQGDYRNTGGLYFYPQDKQAASLPPDYQEWQEESYLQFHGEDRPTQAPTEHTMELFWALGGKKAPVRGVLDLEALQKGFELEYHQAFSALIEYSQHLPEGTAIDFKFLKAGMGFFLEGLRLLNNSERPISSTDQNDDFATLELRRLQGILSALMQYPDNTDFGRVKRLSLPFSKNLSKGASAEKIAQINDTFVKIEKQCQRLHLEWGGAERRDALAPTSGFITATTNCADPHALIGNEGGHASVDASISTNIPDIFLLNVAYNKSVCCLAYTEPDVIPVPVDIPSEPPPASEPQSVQQAEKTNPWLKKLVDLLNDIKAKEENLRGRNHIKAADQALALHQRIDKNRDKLIAKTITPSFFEEDSLTAIKESKTILEKHRETKGMWVQILGNLGLAIAGLAIFYLAAGAINYAINGRFLFFPPETAGHLDNLRNHIKSQGSEGLALN